MLCSYRNFDFFFLTRFSQLTAALVTFCILAADSTLLLAQHDGARDSVQQIALGKFEKVDQILEKKETVCRGGRIRIRQIIAISCPR